MTYHHSLDTLAATIHDPVSINPDVLAAFGAGRKVRIEEDHFERIVRKYGCQITADETYKYLTFRGVKYAAPLAEVSR